MVVGEALALDTKIVDSVAKSNTHEQDPFVIPNHNVQVPEWQELL